MSTQPHRGVVHHLAEAHRDWNGWLSGLVASTALVAAVTGIIWLLKTHVPLLGLSVLYLFAVLPIAVFWGLALSVPVSIASMLAFNFFFLPPSMRSPSRTRATGLRWASSSSPPSRAAISPRAREHFDRIVAPAPAGSSHGFTPNELQWILVHAPSETLILRPDPTLAEEGQLARTLEAVA